MFPNYSVFTLFVCPPNTSTNILQLTNWTPKTVADGLNSKKLLSNMMMAALFFVEARHLNQVGKFKIQRLLQSITQNNKTLKRYLKQVV